MVPCRLHCHRPPVTQHCWRWLMNSYLCSHPVWKGSSPVWHQMIGFYVVFLRFSFSLRWLKGFDLLGACYFQVSVILLFLLLTWQVSAGFLCPGAPGCAGCGVHDDARSREFFCGYKTPPEPNTLQHTANQPWTQTVLSLRKGFWWRG